MAEELTPEQRRKEVSDETNKALPKYFSRSEPIVPNSIALKLSEDIKLALWRVTLHKGVYFIPVQNVDTKDLNKMPLYALSLESVELSFNPDSSEEIKQVIEEGRGKIEGAPEVKMSLEPLKIPNRTDEKPFTLAEAALWGAIQDALKTQDVDKANRLFMQAYNISSPLFRVTSNDIESAEDIKETQLATYKPSGYITTHSLVMKALEGLQSIAYGAPSYEIQPRGGKSREKYSITGSQENCSKFFFNCSGNVEQLKKIAEVVYTLAIDEKAYLFEQGGRVWFTAASIAEHISRTEGGALRGDRYPLNVALVEAALLSLSGAQIQGTDAHGKPTNVLYVINAERREKITYKGKVYTDVWGISAVNTVGEYGKIQGRNYKYPLIESPKPLSLDESGYERYLNDLLHELRGKLYTAKGGKVKPTYQKKATITRNYETYRADKIGVFQHFYPLQEPTSRQKRKLIEGLDKVLKKLAAMEVHGDRREGMPLSITAYSERNPSRGRGGGAWEKLVITATRNTRAPEIDLLSDGK